jgi:Transposase
VLDLSGPYRKTFDDSLAHVTQVADPVHLVKLANSKLDECRRRVQNDTLGHRGRKDDPLYRARRLLTKAHERLDDAATRSCAACSRPATGAVRCGWPGMRRRSSAPSTRSPTPSSPASSSTSSASTCKTSRLLYAAKPNWDLLPTVTPR